jgi:hypothetical protein
MQHLDRQLAIYRDRLCSDIGLSEQESKEVATLVAAEVRLLPAQAKREIVEASPVPIAARYAELVSYQSWSDLAASVTDNPAVTRASVVVQNYICFVYLKDACFEAIAKLAPRNSVAARTSMYLSRGKVRDFRNAFSHANWSYNATFTGLDCWVLEDQHDRSGPMRQFEVTQAELNCWQTLARCVAYAAYEELRDI